VSFLSEAVREILIQAAKNIVQGAQNNLEDGDLKKSIKFNPTENSVEIVMSKYGIFQDRGVSGRNSSDFKGKKKTLHKSLDNYKFKSEAIGGEKRIDKWMYKQGIQPRDEKTGRFLKRKSVNFLIRRSIAQHGIKPSLFLTKPYEKYREEILEEFNRLHEQIKKDIDNG